MPVHRPLAKYTGESLGMQYLFDQTGMAMTPLPDPNQLDKDVDEGFEDTECFQETAQFNEEIGTFAVSVDEEESDIEEVSICNFLIALKNYCCVLIHIITGH